jgi:hypothetical protein
MGRDTIQWWESKPLEDSVDVCLSLCLSVFNKVPHRVSPDYTLVNKANLTEMILHFPFTFLPVEG